MIVDSSAIMAIILNEPERHAMIEALGQSDRNAISAGTWIELSAVLTRRPGNDLFERLRTVTDVVSIFIEPVSVEQAEIGHQAYRRYGRGSGHKSDLNFGDCFAYALAKATGEPLLFKGNDFSQTDIKPALTL
ncbi:type II toxin-antitoxin system VapC family toxin [Sphingomonas sp. GB1N7]